MIMLRSLSAATMAALWLSLSLPSTDAKNKIQGLLNKNDIPDSGRDWISFANGVEFQPGADTDVRLENLRRHLGYSSTTTTNNGQAMQQPYVDGSETYYDEYAQAWRALGWYIDCSSCGGDDHNNNNDNANGLGSCVGAGEGGGGGNNNDNTAGCQRYLLWAAYVDLDYEGYRVHEYQYYDRKSNQWSDLSCRNVANVLYDEEDRHGNDNDQTNWSNLTPVYGQARCVKMDCHLENTHYKLLGIFKEPKYNEWMEQLFKHEGDCLWDDYEYEFMQSDREAWPKGCTASETHETSDGGMLYYDLKPTEYGGMDIGLYTDDLCIDEYTGSFTVEEVLQAAGYQAFAGNNRGNNGDNNKGNVLALAEEIQAWNDAFDVYKQCQPCKTYLLTHIVAGLGSEYNVTGNRNPDDGRDHNNDDDDDDNYHCHDAAGYDNVNQCMKFKTKTRMVSATWADFLMADAQGTTTQLHVVDHTGGKAHMGYNKPIKFTVPGTHQSYARGTAGQFAAFFLSIIALAYGFATYQGALNRRDEHHRILNSPLIT